MCHHQRRKNDMIPANGHLPKGRIASTVRTATEIAQYEAAVDGEDDPGIPSCSAPSSVDPAEGILPAKPTSKDTASPTGSRTAPTPPTSTKRPRPTTAATLTLDKTKRKKGSSHKRTNESVAVAHNRATTVQAASSATSRQGSCTCLDPYRSRCDVACKLKLGPRTKDTALTRQATRATAAAAAAGVAWADGAPREELDAQRTSQEWAALLRREHQLIGQSYKDIPRMTYYKTRSKQNSGPIEKGSITIACDGESALYSSERTQSNLGRGSRKICTRIRHGNSGPLDKRHGGT